MTSAIVKQGQISNFSMLPPYANPGMQSDPLNLFVMPGGTANVIINTNDDPSSTMALMAEGGAIHLGIASHNTATGSLMAVDGGRIDFTVNPSTSFHNTMSLAQSGGDIEVPVSVVGQGLFIADSGGRIAFGTGYDPLAGFPGSSVAATQTVLGLGGTIVIDDLPAFQAPVLISAGATVEIDHVADFGITSATYDAKAHVVDFVGGGKTLYAMSLTVLGSQPVDIASTASGFAVTDPIPARAAMHALVHG